jgi:hypothetical protein
MLLNVIGIVVLVVATPIVIVSVHVPGREYVHIVVSNVVAAAASAVLLIIIDAID